MKKSLMGLLLLSFSLTSFAQQYPSAGYYRVHNKATNRYVYVSDNEGSINMSNGTADLGALCLWMNPDKRLSDPASVVYLQVVETSSHKYDIKAQNTGVYDMIQHYVQMNATSGGYEVYATQGNFTRYLADERKSKTRDDGQMGISNTGDYRIWIPTAISATSDEYFGIKPVLSANGKFYYPFFASFPFKFASSGMKAYYISTVDKNQSLAVLKEYKDEVKAGGVPYIIECSSEDVSDNRLEILVSGGSVPSDNLLLGNYYFNPKHTKAVDNNKAYKEFDASKMRVLEVSASGKLQFVNNSDRLETTDKEPGKKFLPANQSYLPVAAGTAATLNVVLETDYVGISEVESDLTPSAIYSITGARLESTSISELPAGIYVIDGRKIQIR